MLVKLFLKIYVRPKELTAVSWFGRRGDSRGRKRGGGDGENLVDLLRCRPSIGPYIFTTI